MKKANKQNFNFHKLNCLYFAIAFFFLFTININAYIDPSIVTYAVQAIAGIAIGIGAFANVIFRKMRKNIGSKDIYDSEEDDNLYFYDKNDQKKYQLTNIESKIEYIENVKETPQENNETAKQSVKERIIEILPQTIFLVMTVGIFVPSSLFLGNIDEFKIGYTDILPLVFVVSIILFLFILLCAVIFKNKIYIIGSTLVFVIALGCYLQNNFLNPAFTELNGDLIDWSKYRSTLFTSSIVWVLIIVVFLYLAFKKTKLTKTIIKYSSYLLTFTQIVALVFLLFNSHRTFDNSFYITKKNEFNYSKNKNTVVFVVDTLDAYMFEDMIIDNDKYDELLKGFTYFDNAIAGGAPTILGIPTMLTGQIYDPKISLADYHKEAYGNARLYEDLNNNNCRINLFTDFSYLSGIDFTNIDNAEVGLEYYISQPRYFTQSLYKLTCFNVMPQILKPYFWIYGEVLNVFVDIRGENDLFRVDDVEFYQDFINGDHSFDDDRNLFVLYHFNGAHTPFVMDENAMPIEETNDFSARDNQVHGNFKIILSIIDEMKKAGVYEDSTIIITSDHGATDLYQRPALAIKLPGAQENFEINNAPVTFENLYVSFAQSLLPNTNEYGKGLFDVTTNDVRYHTAYKDLGIKLFPEDSYVTSHDYTMYEFAGDPMDYDKLSIIKN